MKSLTRFLMVALCLVAPAARAAVPTTAGSNLTAYNPTNMGSVNNNNWNNAMNARTGGGDVEANFGNCNSLILRCAQPKCASGGCTSMDVATPIVSGCVKSNESCKKYGDDLIQTIAAQLVANSTAKANQQMAAAQAAATAQATAESQQQLQAMQSQMQAMQSQMTQQNAAATQQLQSALEEQKQLTAQALAEVAAAQAAAQAAQTAPAANPAAGVSESQVAAASNGVSADVLARQQISGQIMDDVESAMVAMKSLKATMADLFKYAGCDARGNNCTGPKRVKIFKEKAVDFFDPYETVLDEIYSALELAISVGVDVTDIFMMLNGTCHSWGKFMCGPGQVMHYNPVNCVNGRTQMTDSSGKPTGLIQEGQACTVGQVVPMNLGGCQLLTMLKDETIQQDWLYPEAGSDGNEIRVGCMSEALQNSVLFRGRNKQASIDIDTLKRIIEQDAPTLGGGSLLGRNRQTSVVPDATKYCAVTPDSYAKLQQAALMKKLPDTVCVTERELERAGLESGVALGASNKELWGGSDFVTLRDCNSAGGELRDNKCYCNGSLINPQTDWCIKTEETQNLPVFETAPSNLGTEIKVNTNNSIYMSNWNNGIN